MSGTRLRRKVLQAEKLEIETLITRGKMRPIGEIVREFEARNGATKSMLGAIPNRLSPAAEDASPEELEAMVASEIEQVVGALAGA